MNSGTVRVLDLEMGAYTMSDQTGGVPDTKTRVEANTAEAINQRNERAIEDRVIRLAGSGSEGLTLRIRELEQEWDIERVLETNAGAFSLVGLGIGLFVTPVGFLLVFAVGSFLIQHAIQGWCPPVPLFRRLGIRTQREIDREKTALRILRGDFQPTSDPRAALQQATGQ